MLRKAQELKQFKLGTTDGEIGRIDDFYFDDLHWTIRYLIVGTGGWLADRRVLISPYALGATDELQKVIGTTLTKKQIELSPSLTTDEPVSRQFEEEFYGYYGWPMYWMGPYGWGTTSYPARDPAGLANCRQSEDSWDPNLRSTLAVDGNYVQAQDGAIGHVHDFIIDDETWAIRYLIVNTSNWWLGKQVLLSPHWIERVSWSESKVYVNLPRETIRQAPEYGPESLNRGYEIDLHRHYDRKGYWVDEYRREAVHSHH